jgi:uncharacterized membrane protein
MAVSSDINLNISVTLNYLYNKAKAKPVAQKHFYFTITTFSINI